MKIIISTLLLILSVVVWSHSQNVSEVDMQKLGQAMQEMMECMSKIDQAEFAVFEETSEQFEQEIEQLCSQGERDKAQKKAIANVKELKKNPIFKQMVDCAEINKKYGIPQGEDEISIMDPDFDFSKYHICDDYQ